MLFETILHQIISRSLSGHVFDGFDLFVLKAPFLHALKTSEN